MSHAYNQRKKTIKRDQTFIDPATGKECFYRTDFSGAKKVKVEKK